MPLLHPNKGQNQQAEGQKVACTHHGNENLLQMQALFLVQSRASDAAQQAIFENVFWHTFMISAQ